MLMAKAAAQIKWCTPVVTGVGSVRVSFRKPLLILGSCFADNIGGRMRDVGFDALVNPLGTMYNPVSIASSLRRIVSCEEFREEECVAIGAGDGRICSFWHHTRHARATVEEFLADANESLRAAHEHWRRTDTLIVTLGTAWCFRHKATDRIVGNCLKHLPTEFTRFRLSESVCEATLEEIVRIAGGREVIFTVSPIRHMADGAHGNQLSKSTLLLAADAVVRRHHNVEYFPSYEILMDELRDYRFYADDLTHPSALAEGYVFDRFMEFALTEGEWNLLQEGIKRAKRASHRDMGGQS